MAKKQPLYPHVPKSRLPATPPRRVREPGLRFLPDSPEQLAQSIAGIGYHNKLSSAFREAIARANRR